MGYWRTRDILPRSGLALDTDLGERQHGSPGSGSTEPSCWTEGGKDQHVFHGMRKVRKLIRIGQNSIVLYPAIRIHVSFDYQRIFADRAQSETQAALLQFGIGGEH